MTNEEAAYIAGLFDGEGNIMLNAYRASKNGHKYLRLFVRITNTHLPALEWVKQVVGAGSVQPHQRVRRGKRKPAYVFVIANAKAKALVLRLRPFLHIKGDQVDELLAGRHSGRA